MLFLLLSHLFVWTAVYYYAGEKESVSIHEDDLSVYLVSKYVIQGFQAIGGDSRGDLGRNN